MNYLNGVVEKDSHVHVFIYIYVCVIDIVFLSCKWSRKVDLVVLFHGPRSIVEHWGNIGVSYNLLLCSCCWHLAHRH